MNTLQPFRILIVEDDKASWEVLERRMQSNEYEIDVAATGEVAQERMRAKHYHLVVVDLALPGLDGWGLLKWMQQPNSGILSDTKVVALTAYYDPSVAQQAREAGFIQCYAKPATQAIVEEMKALVTA